MRYPPDPDPERLRRRLGRRLFTVPVALIVVALATIFGVLGEHGGSTGPHSGASSTTTLPATTTTTAPTPSVPVTRPVLGVYAGPGAAAAAEAFSKQLPGHPHLALDYLSDSSWTTISDPSWLLGRWQGSGEAMVLEVPMLPRSGGSLAAGATGSYDHYFASLARKLVSENRGRSTLIVGWSPEQSSLPWSVATRAGAADYVAYFRHVVTTMRSVPGTHFSFAFEPGAVDTASAVAPDSLYPGNAYVDAVAAQVFDVVWSPVPATRRFAAVRAAEGGLSWAASFAASHHKSVLVSALGLAPIAAHGDGDDPVFVRQFLAWARAHDVTTVIIWAQGSAGITARGTPEAFAVLRNAAATHETAP